jgi:hypothetical protein
MWRAGFALLLLGHAARADVPLTGMLGLGVTTIGDTGYGGSTNAVALDALLAYEVGPHVAIGVRFATATATSYAASPEYDANVTNGEYEQLTYSVIPIDLGVTALFSHRGFWIAPWVGEHISISTATDNLYGSYPTTVTADFTMLGLSVGVDLLIDDHDKLGLYADYRHNISAPHDWVGADDSSPDNPNLAGWGAFTVGIAYRR